MLLFDMFHVSVKATQIRHATSLLVQVPKGSCLQQACGSNCQNEISATCELRLQFVASACVCDARSQHNLVGCGCVAWPSTRLGPMRPSR